MGNLAIGFKKFMQNKNTVTVVGVILARYQLDKSLLQCLKVM